MELSVPGTSLAVDCDWTLCTSLRDNIQHHLEGGQPSGRFPAIHALADRCWAPVTVSARELADELERAGLVLARVPIDRMAISIRSRAALTGAPVAPAVRGTVLLRLTGWTVPVSVSNARTLGDVFAGLGQQLIEFCSRAGDVDLEVAYADHAMMV